MEIEILTKQDLEIFGQKLLSDLTELVHKKEVEPEKEYLRSKEARKILGVSNATLQNLRVKGLLKPTKIEGMFYYKLSEIKVLLNAGTK